ncbi:MAG: hypothetical protein H6Q71_1727 [Firmicutes bacterium]|nr:hypothetical protein [Bacillota bacterium]
MAKITPEQAIEILRRIIEDPSEEDLVPTEANQIIEAIRDMNNVVQAAEDLLRDCRDKNKCSTLCEPPWGEGCPNIGICKALQRLEGGNNG